MNTIHPRPLIAAIGMIVFSTAMSTSALAQAQASDKNVAQAEPEWVLGAGVAYAPEYPGADKSRLYALPVIGYHNKNGFFASTYEGIGYGAKLDRFSLSGAISYRAGRYETSNAYRTGSRDLKGLGDINGSALLRLRESYTFDNGISTHLGADLALSNRETGNTYSLGVSAPLYQTKHDQVGLDLGATYGDRKYNQSFFGVTATQSANSGYRAFTSKAGFDQIASSVTWTHVLDKNWSVRTTAGLSHTIGDVADSPIVKKKTNGIFATSFNYAF